MKVLQINLFSFHHHQYSFDPVSSLSMELAGFHDGHFLHHLPPLPLLCVMHPPSPAHFSSFHLLRIVSMFVLIVLFLTLKFSIFKPLQKLFSQNVTVPPHTAYFCHIQGLINPQQ